MQLELLLIWQFMNTTYNYMSMYCILLITEYLLLLKYPSYTDIRIRLGNSNLTNLTIFWKFSGKIGFAGHNNYSASKAGVIAFTKSASKELGKYGIRVNCICPGFIETPMAETMLSEVGPQMIEQIRNTLELQIPLGRFGNPEEVAEVAAFLA